MFIQCLFSYIETLGQLARLYPLSSVFLYFSPHMPLRFDQSQKRLMDLLPGLPPFSRTKLWSWKDWNKFFYNCLMGQLITNQAMWPKTCTLSYFIDLVRGLHAHDVSHHKPSSTYAYCTVHPEPCNGNPRPTSSTLLALFLSYGAIIVAKRLVRM